MKTTSGMRYVKMAIVSIAAVLVLVFESVIERPIVARAGVSNVSVDCGDTIEVYKTGNTNYIEGDTVADITFNIKNESEDSYNVQYSLANTETDWEWTGEPSLPANQNKQVTLKLKSGKNTAGQHDDTLKISITNTDSAKGDDKKDFSISIKCDIDAKNYGMGVSIESNNADFGTVEEGYEPIAERTITVENKGNTPFHVELEGSASYFKITGIPTSDIAPGTSVNSIKIKPNDSLQSTQGLNGVFEEALIFKNSGSNPADNKTLNVKFKVTPPKPVITNAELQNGKKGESYGPVTLTATNNPTSWNVVGLPAGLSFDSNTRVISGTPEAATVEPAIVTVTATNDAGADTKKYSLIIEDPSGKKVTSISITGNNRVPTKGSIQLKANVLPKDASNKGITWSVVSGNGSINNNGLFTAGDNVGPVIVKAAAVDGSGQSVSYNITVVDTEAGGLAITTESVLPSGVVGKPYTVKLAATSKTTVTWEMTNSTILPAGFSPLNTDGAGVISGTPTTGGNYSFYIKATNGGDTETKQFEIHIQPAVISHNTNKNFTKNTKVTDLKSSTVGDFSKSQIEPNKDVKVNLNVESVTSPSDKTTVDERIKTLFNGLDSNLFHTVYLDIALNKQIKDIGGSTTETKAIQEIQSPEPPLRMHFTFADKVGAHTVKVLRNHTANTDGKGLKELERITSNPGEKETSKFKEGTFYAEGNDLYIYSSYFSTYAVVYTTVETVSISFEENGGSSVADLMIEKGKKISEPTAPSRTGYTFDGWYTTSALTTKFDFSSAINADTTLYAKWTSANSNTETTTNTNTTPSRNGLSPANSPQTSDPIDYVRVFAALIVLGAGLIVVLGLKAKK